MSTATSTAASAFHFGPPARAVKQRDFFEQFDLTVPAIRALAAELWARKRSRATMVVGSPNTYGETIWGDNLDISPEEMAEARRTVGLPPELPTAV